MKSIIILNWFIRKNILNRFIYNIVGSSSYRNKVSLKEYLTSILTFDDENIILTAFDWKKTKEGFYYWKNIEDEYSDFYKNINDCN